MVVAAGLAAAAVVFVAAAAVRVEPEHSSLDRDPDASAAVAVVVAAARLGDAAVAAAVEVLPHAHPALAVELVSPHVQPAVHLVDALSAVAAVAVAPAQHVAARVEHQPVAVDQLQAAVAAAAAQREQALATFAVQFLDPDPDARRAP